jgi:uncharacterized protein involved in outer membrane biogenesis
MARWRRHVLHVVLASIALLIVITGGVVILVASIDAEGFKPRIAAAVKRATGRDLVLTGPIHLSFSLRPRMHLEDVGFTNPPGFSRPMMATLQRLDLQLALLPLLRQRIEIDNVTLVAPNLLLETNAEGQTNWVFPVKTKPTDADKMHDRIGIENITVDGGTIGYRDQRSGGGAVLVVSQLLIQAASPDAPLHLTMQAKANDQAFSLTGDVGPITQLQVPETGLPWPINLQLSAGAAKLTIDGNIGQLAKGRLYALQLTGSAPDIASLAALWPGVHLPSLHDATVSARLVDTGKHLELDTTLRIAGVHATAKGVIADVARLAGVEMALSVDAADLTGLGTLAHALPPFQSIALQAALTDEAGDLRHGLALHDISFTSVQADIAGNVIVKYSPRPSVRAKLIAEHIDAGALRVVESTASPTEKQDDTAHLVIPDVQLPFDILHRADAHIEVDVGTLRSRRTVYRSLALRLALEDGRLRLSPFTVDVPEGQLTGTLSVDASPAIPRIDVTLHAPGLEVQPLLHALNLPEEAAGVLRASLELHGAGHTPHAIAAGLNGHLGLAMAHGEISNWLLSNTAGWMLRKAALPGLATEIGSSELRCFALRLDFNHGAGALRSLLMDSSPLYLDGKGTMHFADETLDLRLRPEPRMAGIGVVAPLRVSGSFAHPSVGPDLVATAQANAGMLISAAEWLATPFGWVAENLGIINPRTGGTDECTGALVQGRAMETVLEPVPPLPPLGLAR